MLAGLWVLAGCAGDNRQAGTAEDTVQPNVAPVTTPDSASTAQPGEDLLHRTIDQRIVIYVEASSAELEAERDSVPPDDFAVIADDLMFYRSSAIEYMEKEKIPFLRITGRRPLEFQVNRTPRRLGFADVKLLDFIIVYVTDHEPRIIAPNEVETIREHLPDVTRR